MAFERWQSDDGSVTLFRGDCLDVLPTLSGVDAVVTDPPYGIGLKAKQHKWFKRIGSGYSDLFNDSPEFVSKVVVPVIEHSIRMFGRVIVTPGPKCLWLYPNPSGWGVVFNKSGSGIGPWGFQCAQPVLYYGKCPYTANGLGNRPSSWEQPASDFADDCGHPCPKPIGMTTWLVRRASLAAETILDPFMGSGTTGVACVRTGRKFIGIEIEQKYFDIAKKRILAEMNKLPLFEEPRVIQRELLEANQ